MFMSLAMVMTMMIAMSATVFAAEETTYTVTISRNSTDKAAHTYGAYQLFKGKLETVNGKKVLSDIQWGDNVDGATIITELNKIEGFNLAANSTPTQVAKAISDKNYTNNSAEAQALAEALNKGITGSPKGTAALTKDDASGEITGLVAGYYLVKDTAAVSGEGASTKYILEVVSNVDVAEKASVPSVDKEIAEGDGVKVADYNIGDKIPYTITGTLPSEFAKYNTYKTFTFKDEPSAGLTLLNGPENADKISVKIGNDDITSLFDISIAENKLEVKLKDGVDLKTATHGTDNTKFAANDQIVVSYKAQLNNSAVVGGNGNINKAKIEFSNNPNSQSSGDETGETPEDKTVVFTYTIKALKVEPTEDAAITAEAYGDLSDAEKANYVKVGDKYQKVQALEGAGFTLYKDSVSDDNKVAEITTGSTFEFKGVDVGTYILRETTVPAGYNKVPDTTITVSATYTSDKPAKINTLTVTPETAGFTADKASGEVTGKILNEKGSVLPSTGGIGTVIFYVLGSLLVVGCGIVLISKRRMNSTK